MFANVQSAFPKGNLVLGYWPGDHVFTPEMRENAYRFLDHHLKVYRDQSRRDSSGEALRD